MSIREDLRERVAFKIIQAIGLTPADKFTRKQSSAVHLIAEEIIREVEKVLQGAELV
jgi:hypothetical protein